MESTLRNVAILALVIVCWAQGTYAASVKNQDVEVCTTKECVLSAAKIIEAIDTTADPCEDFYQFACGQWIENNPIPESESRWGSFDALDAEVQRSVRKAIEAEIGPNDPQAVKNLKTLYKSCMNIDAIEELGYSEYSNALLMFNGWPIATADWKEITEWSIQNSNLRAFYGLGVLFNPFVFMDSFDVSQNVIYLDQPSLGLPRDFYVDEGSYASYISAYKNFIIDYALILAREGQQNVTLESVLAEAEEIYQFEKKIAQITVPDEDRRNTTEMYNPMDISQLQATYPHVDWETYFFLLLADAGEFIDSTERIIVVEPEYLEALDVLMRTADIRTIVNYLSWRLLMSLATYGPTELADVQFKFASTLYGVSSKPPRYSTCISNAISDTNGYGFAVAHEYVKENFNDQAKQEADEMVDNLRIAFKELVTESLWMDADTQVKAQEKADLMRQLLGYPDYVVNGTLLDEFYNGVDPSFEDQYFLNVFNVKAFMSLKELATLKDVPDREYWFMNPATVNAWYSPNHNSITFPAAILHPPFFRSGGPKCLNYGAIGVVIGHEITHGFDDQGRQYDGIGNAFPWWSDETIAAFSEQAQCFIDMYGNYSLPQLGEDVHVNGVNTQGENIADNGGLRESFRAYKNFVAASGKPEPRLPGLADYTPEQLFFIAYSQVWCQKITDSALLNQVLTDPHSPGRFRVIGPLSNSADFVEQFQCPAGSPMNRNNKCLLW